LDLRKHTDQQQVQSILHTINENAPVIRHWRWCNSVLCCDDLLFPGHSTVLKRWYMSFNFLG